MQSFKYIMHEMNLLQKCAVWTQSGDNDLLVGIKAGTWKMGPNTRRTLPWLTANSEVRSQAARRSGWRRVVMPNPRPSVIIGILGELHHWDKCQRTARILKNARGSESFVKVVQLSNFHRGLLMHHMVELRVHQVESHLLSNPWLTLGSVLANYLHIKHKNDCGSEKESCNYYQ